MKEKSISLTSRETGKVVVTFIITAALHIVDQQNAQRREEETEMRKTKLNLICTGQI